MQEIKRIFFEQDKISIINNHLCTDQQRHWFLQVIVSLEGELKIDVAGTRVQCRCIVIDYNIPHTFYRENKMCYFLFIGMRSAIVDDLRRRMKDNGYLICDNDGIETVQNACQTLMGNGSREQYFAFMEKLMTHLAIKYQLKEYDPRITELIDHLEICDCSNHAISLFAEKVFLSSSRLAHLFKEETGIPLKSYIGLHQMKRAFDMLLEGRTITEAALHSGFDTPSHFASTVKRLSGVSATQLLKDSEILKV